MKKIAQRIADFVSALTYDGLPEKVREKCKVSLLHNLGVALAGQPLQFAPGYAAALSDQVNNAGSRLLISGRATTPDTAAFVNAALMHARAQDDTYFPGLTHAGAIMSPAVLAVGEQLGSSGKDIIVALAAGYEAMGAISQGFAKRTTTRGFRASGIYGGFAAAVGVGHLLKLDAVSMSNAIGLAASAACGTNQTWVAGSQEWQMQVGIASRNGLLSARLAAAGATAAADSLEGEAGFYRAFMGDREGIESVGMDLGNNWRCLDVTYKPFAVCAILQSPVIAAIALSQQHNLRASDIHKIRLCLCPAEAAYPGTDAVGPFADIGATLMSAQFCMALAFSQGRVRGDDLRRLNDPLIQPLAQRTSVVPDSSLGARSFVIEVDLANGQTLRHYQETVGEPFNWNREEVCNNLSAMAGEIPLESVGLGSLCTTVLNAEGHDAKAIISACITNS